MPFVTLETMQYRDYKIFAPTNYYHIYNRGNGKMDIFLDQQDFLYFIKRFKLVLGLTKMSFASLQRASLHPRFQPLPAGALSIVCYCLMPNHFHFLIRQNADIPISKLMSKVCASYSKYFNKKYKRVGGVFQDQFKAVHVKSDAQLLWLSAYMHNNPKTAGLVNRAEDWQWSSYQDYLSLRQGTLSEKDLILSQFKSVLKYQNFVENSLEKIKQRKEMDNLLLE